MSYHSNTYKHPWSGIVGRVAEWLANSDKLANARYAVMSRIPFLTLESDVTNVVYLTWLIDIEAAQALVPAGTRLWQRAGKTPFTVLTYRHGHFGPAVLGPFRRLFPSPMQSNWRLYLEETSNDASPISTVFFLKNVMNSLVYTLGTRIFSDVLPTHLAAQFSHRTDGSTFESKILSGEGSSPSLICSARLASTKSLASQFTAVFGTWQNAVEYLSGQEAAVAHVKRLNRLVVAEIQLPIDLSQVLPLDASANATKCSLLEHLPPANGPFCFVVPNVKFRVLSERML
ncbi:hypothetical protein [Undibacterium sp.]|jgi:hypothetical protein|uniref:hypothetical protein n=1 Tax=Undibacterium sp. TaxID=1914977 RepID=UPI002CD0EA45|nr:hypothetical protein [Undibacterium sp.]HTD05529.1 hypothetical protein [Undibacterium sp.]